MITNQTSGKYPSGTRDEVTIGTGNDANYQVSDFGGSFGDTLVAAIDALKTGGGIVRILPGTYTLDKDVAITKSDVSIIGYGASSDIDLNGFSITVGDEGTPADVSNVKINSLSVVGSDYSSSIKLGTTNSTAIDTLVTDNIFSGGLSNFPVYGNADDGVTNSQATNLYLIDDGAGTDLDDATGSNDIVGGITGATWTGASYKTYTSSVAVPPLPTIPGNPSDSLSFNGTTDFVNVGTQLLPTASTQPFSIEAWVKVDPSHPSGSDGAIVSQKATVSTATSDAGIVFKYDPNILGASSNTFVLTIKSTVDGTGVDESIAAPAGSAALGSWQHVVVTYDGSNDMNNAQIYINGSPVTKVVLGDPIINGADISNAFNTNFAAAGNGADGFLTGEIGLVSIWNVALTAGQVADRYDKTFNIFATAFEDVNETGTLVDGNIINVPDGIGV